MTTTSADVARVLDSIADLLELDQASPFRVRAHRNAADSLRFLDPPLADLVAAGEDLTALQDVGAGIAKKIEEIVAKGADAYLAELDAGAPGLLELLRIPGIGPKRARDLRALGIASVDALREAAESGRLGEVPGFGPKTVERILRRLARSAEQGDAPPTT